MIPLLLHIERIHRTEADIDTRIMMAGMLVMHVIGIHIHITMNVIDTMMIDMPMHHAMIEIGWMTHRRIGSVITETKTEMIQDIVTSIETAAKRILRQALAVLHRLLGLSLLASRPLSIAMLTETDVTNTSVVPMMTLTKEELMTSILLHERIRINMIQHQSSE
jgi:hypothetical protein